MTLFIESQIKGNLVYRVQAVNMRHVNDSECLYKVRYEKFNENEETFEFEIIHGRNKGAEGLTLLIFQEVERRKTK